MEHISKQEQRPKEGYLTKQSAIEAMHVMEYKYKEPFNVYICKTCGKWHVGRQNGVKRMDELTKIAACAIEIQKLLDKIKGELTAQEDRGLIEFGKKTDNFLSWLLDVGAIELNEKTKEYEVTAQVPYKVLWILHLNDAWWLTRPSLAYLLDGNGVLG